MKKVGMFLAMVLVIGVVATGCSSKETKAEEPVVSGGAADTSAPVAQAPSANLGGSSSGQGR